MLSKKQMTELDKIIEIAREKENRINSMLFYNLIVAMPGGDRVSEKVGDLE